MKTILSVFTLFITLFASCNQQIEIRKISLQSHLERGPVKEPVLLSGELIQYIPNKKDPFHLFEPVTIQLPKHHSQAYLKGYAFGYAAQKNSQVKCILGLTNYGASEYYHSGCLNGGRDAMGHEKWDELFGDIFDEFMEK